MQTCWFLGRNKQREKQRCWHMNRRCGRDWFVNPFCATTCVCLSHYSVYHMITPKKKKIKIKTVSCPSSSPPIIKDDYGIFQPLSNWLLALSFSTSMHAFGWNIAPKLPLLPWNTGCLNLNVHKF